MGKEEHRKEEKGYNPRSDFDFLNLSAEKSDNHVRDKTERDTVRNVVSERHYSHREECGNGNGNVRPFDILNATDHENSHVNERGAVSNRRYKFRYGSKEQRDEEPAVTSEENPVLPPAATPEEDSTNVVTVEVPKTAPVQVAIASASIALSMFTIGEFEKFKSMPRLEY